VTLELVPWSLTFWLQNKWVSKTYRAVFFLKFYGHGCIGFIYRATLCFRCICCSIVLFLCKSVCPPQVGVLSKRQNRSIWVLAKKLPSACSTLYYSGGSRRERVIPSTYDKLCNHHGIVAEHFVKYVPLNGFLGILILPSSISAGAARRATLGSLRRSPRTTSRMRMGKRTLEVVL